jgi:hypothetical protein
MESLIYGTQKRESGVTIPFIDTSWRLVVPSYYGCFNFERSVTYDHWIRWFMGLKNRSETFGEETDFLFLPGMELILRGHGAHSPEMDTGFSSHYGLDIRWTKAKRLFSLAIRPDLASTETVIQMGVDVFVPWEKDAGVEMDIQLCLFPWSCTFTLWASFQHCHNIDLRKPW